MSGSGVRIRTEASADAAAISRVITRAFASRSMRRGLVGAVLCLVPFASSCAHLYQPLLDPRESKLPAEWRVDAVVAVVNDETSTEKIELLDNGVQTFFVDRATLSEASAQLMRHLLASHGMSVDSPASKELKLRVVEGTVERGVWVGYCLLTLEVDTASGLHKTFAVKAHSGDLLHACNRSLARAVGAAMLDPEISAYLHD